MSNLLLIKLIKKFRSRDMTAFAVIYKEFEGLILYYSAKLGGEDYSQELTIFLIELLYDLKITDFKSDSSEGVKRYIAVSLRNKYIALSKEKQKYDTLCKEAYENDFCYYSSADERLLLEDMLKGLSQRQRLVVVYKYIYGYSDAELGVMFNISRQAVNRLKNRAICILQEYYIGGKDKELRYVVNK